jgi:hypothetical protein
MHIKEKRMNTKHFLEMFPDATVIKVDVGNRVICDSCNEEYTGLPFDGGLLFQRKAICPKCAPKWRELAKKYNEERFIKENEDGTFYHFVLRNR